MPSAAELFDQAVRAHQAGQVVRAEELYHQVLAADPKHAGAMHLLGVAAHQAGQFAVAIRLIKAAIEIDGRQAVYHCNLGEALRASGEFAAAKEYFLQAVTLNPNLGAAYHNLGLTMQVTGDLDDARQNYERAIQLAPGHAEAHNNLGNVFFAQGKAVDAARAYQRALRCRPYYVEALSNLCTALIKLKRHQEAVDLLRQALEWKPDSAEIHHNLGNAYKNLGKNAEALASFAEAVRLCPDLHEARNRLGLVLHEQGRFDEAADCFEQVLKYKSDDVYARTSLGLAYQQQGKLAEARTAFVESLRIDPDFGMARLHLGTLMLLQGEFAEGWQHCEWRYRTKVEPRNFPQPEWDGSSLEGRTILVHPEQGAGDVLQFVRYVPLVRKLAKSVILEVQPALVPLFAASGMPNVVAFGSSLPLFDVHILLMSLPRMFNTRADTIPADVPYLAAPPALVEAWRQRLHDLTGFRVGINWQGNPEYTYDALRSVPLVEFAPLAAVPGVQLISLQQREGLAQLPIAQRQFKIHELGTDVDTEQGPFVDTAAIMKNLDLVITSDTATAHLAGALGVPVWVATSYIPEWRWMLEREDSPWYPTMRLFRQKNPRDWSEVFRRIAEALASQPRRPL